MPQRTNDFQQLVTMIMELLVDGEVVESKEFPDPDTGEPREVDIYALIEGKLPDGRQIRIAVECIAWSRKADAPWVEKMYGKHCRLQVADVVLLVADKGFTPQRRRRPGPSVTTRSMPGSNQGRCRGDDWVLGITLR